MSGVTQLEDVIARKIEVLMKEGKDSRHRSWEINSIVNKIGEEFGEPYKKWAYNYIMKYCEIDYELWRK